MATKKGHRIGEMLLDEEIITKEQLQECLREQKVTGEKVGEVLVRKGYVSQEVLMAFLGNQYGVPYISLQEMQNVPANLIKLLPEPLMRSQHVIAVEKKGNTLVLAMADPANVFVTDDIKMSTRMDLELRLTSEKEIKAALDKHFGFKEEETGELVKTSTRDDAFGGPAPAGMGGGAAPAAPSGGGLASVSSTLSAAAAAAAPDSEPAAMSAIPTATMTGAGDTPVINFLTSVLVEASKARATDIHFEPYERTFRIRWRIDGILQEVQSPPRTLASALAAKIKTMAEMNPNEKFKAQTGRLKLKIPGKEISLAIMIAPTLWGEKIVMRILNAEAAILELDKIGMEANQLEIYRHGIQEPHGLILVIGPRASGKSSTAYATLSALNHPTKNVSAVDEPVDFSIAGVNQVVVNEKRGVTYDSGLRAMLDQDSDILLVGEMHDQATAQMIMEAVPTGHLVLSTLHANDAVGAIQTLINMGAEAYLIGSALRMLVNQRLVRVVCAQCKENYEAPPEVAKRLGLSAGKRTLVRGRGCAQCSNTGYRGRLAVFEVLPVSDTLREAIVAQGSAGELKKIVAGTSGFVALKDQLAAKIAAGITTYDELLRVAGTA